MDWNDVMHAPRPVEPALVTAELILETARTCRDLARALETVDVEAVTQEGELLRARVRRITLFAALVPSILDPRRIIALADRAADSPDWWRANRLHCYCPELTYAGIGSLIGAPTSRVRDCIHSVEIPNTVYDNLPEYE